jgi:hypothetical protein
MGRIDNRLRSRKQNKNKMTVILLIAVFALPTLLIFIDFLKYLITGTRLYNQMLIGILDVIVVIALPILYLIIIDENKNDCCTDSATFSPAHKLTIYILIAICSLTYFYSGYKKTIKSPILEVLTNSILLLGIMFNIFIAIQIKIPIWLLGNLPIGLLFTLQLAENQKRFLESDFNSEEARNFLERIAWKILGLRPVLKFPVLLMLCLPILIVITSLLLLFGQKPDSIIRVFTDTYKHSFSQLDYLCDNVKCGGHYLCSIAANGHRKIVKPIRYGERNGNKIICNRQLLVANAFEELIEEKMPVLHKHIRHYYNKVGNLIHRYYRIFNNKFVADFFYILMKPAEIIFLLILYTFDQNPENRIAQQYCNKLGPKYIE